MSPRDKLVRHLERCEAGCGLKRDGGGALVLKRNGTAIEEFCAVGAELDAKRKRAPKPPEGIV